MNNSGGGNELFSTGNLEGVTNSSDVPGAPARQAREMSRVWSER